MVFLTNVNPPTEGVRLIQPQIRVFIENQDSGDGTLTIAESSVTWIGLDGRGFSLTYPSMCLHAISRDLSNFPHECLYLMVDARKGGQKRRPEIIFSDVTDTLASFRVSHNDTNKETNKEDDLVLNGTQQPAKMEEAEAEDEEEEEEPGLVQIRFVPADKSVLDKMFEVMSDCQTLHPDDEDDFSDDQEDTDQTDNPLLETGDWMTSSNDVTELNEEGRANLERIMRNSDDQRENHQENEHEMDQN